MADGKIGLGDATEPAVIAEEAYDLFRSRFPGWEANEGAPETVFIEGQSQEASVGRALASRTEDDIFRRMGQIVGILPLEPSKATVETTWTMVDDLGHSIPAGTQVALIDTNGEQQGFQVVADVTVPPESMVTATGEVILEATVAGAAGSGISTFDQLINPVLAFVGEVTLEGITTGGTDGETTAGYLDRLTRRLRLMATRVILPADAEALIRDVAGVARAVVIDNYFPGRNEIQRLTSTATGGTLKLTFDGQQTAAINWNAAASAIQSALELLSNIASGDIIVTGGPLNTAPVDVEFTETLGLDDQPLMSVASSLTGGACTPSTVQAGAPSDSSSEGSYSWSAIGSEGQPLPSPTITEIDTLLHAQALTGLLIAYVAPTYTTIDVEFEATALPGFNADTVKASAIAAVESFLSPANWGRPNSGDVAGGLAWLNEDTVRYFEIVHVLEGVEGVRHVTLLEVDGGLGDVPLSGAVPLPEAGTVTATVTAT